MIVCIKELTNRVIAKDFSDVTISDDELLCTRYTNCSFHRVTFGEMATRQNFEDCYFENCNGYKEPPHGSYYIRADLARPMTVAEAAKVLLGELDVIEPVNAQAKMAVHTWLSNRALSQGGE